MEHTGGIGINHRKTADEAARVRRQRGELTATIGIRIYPDDGPDAETPVRRADTAMYCAKNRRRNPCQFVERRMDMPAVWLRRPGVPVPTPEPETVSRAV